MALDIWHSADEKHDYTCNATKISLLILYLQLQLINYHI